LSLLNTQQGYVFSSFRIQGGTQNDPFFTMFRLNITQGFTRNRSQYRKMEHLMQAESAHTTGAISQKITKSEKTFSFVLATFRGNQ
jgi:hypothetical protein